MRIEVNSLPPVECSPNSRAHWSKRYKASRLYQAEVFYACVDERNKLEMQLRRTSFLPFNKARLDLTFIFSCSRRRDEDNLRAQFKPGQDALVQAQLLADDNPDNLIMGKINIIVDPKRAPRTIIELEKIY